MRDSINMIYSQVQQNDCPTKWLLMLCTLDFHELLQQQDSTPSEKNVENTINNNK